MHAHTAASLALIGRMPFTERTSFEPLCEQFVLGMLENLGVISEEQYRPFVEQFGRLDVSGDGKHSRVQPCGIIAC